MTSMLSMISRAYWSSARHLLGQLCSNPLPIHIHVFIVTCSYVSRSQPSYCSKNSRYNPLSDTCAANNFFHSVTCHFIFLMVSFKEWKSYILRKSSINSFLLWFMRLVSNPWNFYLTQHWKSKVSRSLALTFMSMIHLGLIFRHKPGSNSGFHTYELSWASYQTSLTCFFSH